MELTLYYRESCHLCDAMRKALVAFQRQHPIVWQEIDINRCHSLIEMYDVKVPVLCFGEIEICHHFFDADTLNAVINRLSPNSIQVNE